MKKQKQMTIKSVGEEDGVFEGYLSTYGNTDRDGDIINKGAFDNSLAKKTTVPMCFNHDWNKVVGKMELSSDDKGLKAKGTLNLADPEAQNIHNLMKMGALDSMSIGMMVKEYEPLDAKQPYWQWEIKEAEVWEGSIVTIPANEQATIDKVKNAKQAEFNEKKNKLVSQLDELAEKLGGKKLMGLKELYELLKGIQANKDVKTKQLEDLQIKVKAATDEDLENLKSQVDALSDEIDGLITEETDVQSQIDEADESLKSLSKELEKAKQKEKGTKNMNYLKSKEAAIEYAKMLADNQGVSNRDLSEKWAEHLTSKGVTGLDNLLPEPILLAIEDEFKDYQGVLNHVAKDPRYSAKVVLQSVQNFAKGHKAGKTKKNADLAFTSFNINSETIYIKAEFDYADLKKDTTGRYFNYMMSELAKGFIRAVERAVVIGDGLAPEDDDKITEIKSIAEETNTKLFDTHEIDLDAETFTTDQLNALEAGVDKLFPLGEPILITTKAIARKLKNAVDANGIRLEGNNRGPISQTGNMIHNYTVYVYDFMNASENPIIAFADKAYTLIGDGVGADKFEDYDVTVNKREIELASVMGGRISSYKGAVKFTAKAAVGG